VWPTNAKLPKNSDNNNAVDYDPKFQARRTKDAAGIDAVLGTSTYFAKVKDVLLFYATPGLSQGKWDINNTTLWNTTNGNNVGDSNPSFGIAELLTCLLFSYRIYRDKNLFTTQERDLLDDWFVKFGHYFRLNQCTYFRSAYPNWATGSSVITSAGLTYIQNTEASQQDATYYDANTSTYGPIIGQHGRRFNNRNATQVYFIQLVGLYFEDATLITFGKQWFAEWIKHAVGKNLEIADLHRGTEVGNTVYFKSTPELGLDYCWGVIGNFGLVAYLYWAKGDAYYVNFSTSEGSQFNTAITSTATTTTPKTLENIAIEHLKYMNGTHRRYATNGESGWTGITGNDPNGRSVEYRRIDGVDLYQSRSDITYDTWLCALNQFAQNDYIFQNYTRQYAGCRPWPIIQKQKNIGSKEPYNFNSNIYPIGALYWFGDREGKISIGGVKTDQVITFGVLASRVYGVTPFSLTASTTSGLTITYVSSDPSIASIVGNLVTVHKAGTVTITASQAGNDSYNAAESKQQTLVITKKALQITANNQTKSYNSLNPTPSFSYRVADLVNGDTTAGIDVPPSIAHAAITSSNVGEYAITLSGGSDDKYSFSFVHGVLTITPITALINFLPISDVFVDAPAFAAPVTSNPTRPIVLTIVSGPATIQDLTNIKASNSAAGLVTVRASQPADLNYNASLPVERTFTVNKLQSTILVTGIPPLLYDNSANFSITATSSNGTPISAQTDGIVLQLVDIVGSQVILDILTDGNGTVQVSNEETATTLPVTVNVQIPVQESQEVPETNLLDVATVDPDWTYTSSLRRSTLYKTDIDLPYACNISLFRLISGNTKVSNVLKTFKVYIFNGSIWSLALDVLNNTVLDYQQAVSWTNISKVSVQSTTHSYTRIDTNGIILIGKQVII
jgi:hypothetical protein